MAQNKKKQILQAFPEPEAILFQLLMHHDEYKWSSQCPDPNLSSYPEVNLHQCPDEFNYYLQVFKYHHMEAESGSNCFLT